MNFSALSKLDQYQKYGIAKGLENPSSYYYVIEVIVLRCRMIMINIYYYIHFYTTHINMRLKSALFNNINTH